MQRTSIIGFGSLLSQGSAELTFGTVFNFRPAWVPNYRRVWQHAPDVFVSRGISIMETKEMASVSGEYHEGSRLGVTVFEVDNSCLPDFYEREHNFDVVEVEFEDFEGDTGKGLFCLAGSDKSLIKRHGKEYFQKNYIDQGLHSCWHWNELIYPCRVYLRHCLIAASNLPSEISESFEDAVLNDRTTTIREYLASTRDDQLQRDLVMHSVPPECLKHRYNG